MDLLEQRQVIEPGARAMIHSVFELGDTIVREVMVPRTDIVFVERDKTLRQAMSLALRSGFSRIPVVGENEDDVIGIAYLKDLVHRSQEHPELESVEKVTSVMRPATFVPESKPVDELLREMQQRRIHMAIVIDEYGGTAGLVTIEDILEEIVGEITDEYDQEQPAVEWLSGGPGPGDGPAAGDRPGRTVRHHDRGRGRRDGGRPARARDRPGADRRLVGHRGRAAADRGQPGRAPEPDRHGDRGTGRGHLAGTRHGR